MKLITKIQRLKKPIKGSAEVMFAADNYNKAIDDCIEVIEE